MSVKVLWRKLAPLGQSSVKFDQEQIRRTAGWRNESMLNNYVGYRHIAVAQKYAMLPEHIKLFLKISANAHEIYKSPIVHDDSSLSDYYSTFLTSFTERDGSYFFEDTDSLLLSDINNK